MGRRAAGTIWGKGRLGVGCGRGNSYWDKLGPVKFSTNRATSEQIRNFAILEDRVST